MLNDTYTHEKAIMIHINDLIKKRGGVVNLAIAMGKAQSTISRWKKLGAWVDVERCKVFTPSAKFEWQSAPASDIVDAHSQGVTSMAQSKQKPKTQSNGTKPPKSK